MPIAPTFPLIERTFNYVLYDIVPHTYMYIYILFVFLRQ